MPTEEPPFVSKLLAETGEPEIKQKSDKKKRISKKTKSSAESAGKQTKMVRRLTQIYQDEEGHLPDMRKIKIKQSHPALKAFFVVIFLGGLLAAAAWAGFLLMPNKKQFSEDNVALTVGGPKSVISGTTSTYKISYENNQNLALKKAILNVQYPAGFVFLTSDPPSKNIGHTEWNLNEIRALQKNEITITGIMFGSPNQKQSWRVFLTYQPENFGSELQKASILDVAMAKSPFSLSVNGPNRIIIGNASEYAFIVKKESDSQINKLELKPSWPQNFFITSSSPPIGKDYKWIIEPNKTTSSEWVFKITGKFSSSAGEMPQNGAVLLSNSAEIAAALFAGANNLSFNLTGAKINAELTQNDLDFNMAINGSITNFGSKLGDNLNITLSLKNQSDNDLKNAIIKLALDAPSAKKQSILDWPKIEDKFDGDAHGSQISDSMRRGEITWDKNKIPALSKINKNQEIGIDILLPIRDASWQNLSEITTSSQIIAMAEVSFKDQNNVTHALSSNRIIITINSDLKFETRDSVSQNGAKHQISWILTNNFHPLKNMVVSADIYGNATVEPASPPPAGEVKFDQTNKKITWTITEMPEGVDVLALPIAITLNTINPTQELLISKAHVQADDAITGEKLNFMGDETSLR